MTKGQLLCVNTSRWQREEIVKIGATFVHCGGLTLTGCQVPTKATLSLPSSAGQGRENITKGSWVEIRTGRDHSPITVTGRTDLTWGKLI